MGGAIIDGVGIVVDAAAVILPGIPGGVGAVTNGLNLRDDWNVEKLPLQGRHPDEYHKFVQRGIERADSEAGGSKEKFLELFNKYVKEPVKNTPELLRKSGWDD